MSEYPTQVELDAKLATVEARSETKFEKLLGKIELGNSELKGEFGKIFVRLDGVENSTRGLRTTIIGTGIAAVALVAAILVFGQQWFGIGVTTRDIIRATVTEIQAQHPTAAP